MIIKKITLLLILFVPVITQGQIITGEIKDSFGKPIFVANILIKDTETPDDISEYTITRTGKFSFDLKNSYKNILIEITANGYHTTKHIIKNPQKEKIYNKKYILKKNDLKIKEIVIKAEQLPFVVREDTVKYNVDAYLNGTERKIEDLIKNLPGIELNENSGKIKYRGKAIETVLLEGDNLFGYNYTLGTKNINVDMVKQVQAIENYSENPLLKGIENNDKVVLNLKLKKGKLDFSGNMDVGAGIFNNAKAALKINTNILGITRTYKSFATLAYNNIGVNSSGYDYYSHKISLEQLKEKDIYAEKIIPEVQFSDVLSNERVNNNNQYFGNYNTTFKIGKRISIRANLFYINDKISSRQLFENKYLINTDTFVTADENIIKKKPVQYKGDLKIKFHTSKKSLLEYDFRIKQENIETPYSVISNNVNNFESFLESEDFLLKQKLLFTQKLSDNKVLQISVLQSSNNISQIYQLNPSVFNSENNFEDKQKSDIQKNYIKAQSTFLGSSAHSKYTFSVGGIFDINTFQSELLSQNSSEISLIENSKNNINYSQKSAYQSGVYHFNAGNWKISPAYSVSYLSQKLSNNIADSSNFTENLIFEPIFSIRYRLNNSSFLTGKVSYNQFSNSEKYLFQNQVLINNRKTISNTTDLELQKVLNSALFYINNNYSSLFWLNMGINYQNIKGNFFANSTINENFTQINYFYLPQSKSSLNFLLTISKYIPFLESTVKLTSSYSVSEYKNIINNSDLRTNRSQILKIKLYYRTTFDIFIDFQNTFNYYNSLTKSENSPHFDNDAIDNKFTIILKPSKKWLVLLSADYFLPNTKETSENYIFLDATLRFRPKNKRFEFNFAAKNLLNTNKFEQVTISDYSTNIYRINILPRYFLVSMSFNF